MPLKCKVCITKNVGLGEGSALPVGTPIPWPSVTPPTGWLKCNGAVFAAAQYPRLAQAYPALKLPDLRGEFIRGWDDGRGVDAGRQLLSAQGDAIRNIRGQIVAYTQGQTTSTVILPTGVGGALTIYNSGTNDSIIPMTQSWFGGSRKKGGWDWSWSDTGYVGFYL